MAAVAAQKKPAKPDRMDGGTQSNPHVRWCGRGDGRNPVTSTRLAVVFNTGDVDETFVGLAIESNIPVTIFPVKSDTADSTCKSG